MLSDTEDSAPPQCKNGGCKAGNDKVGSTRVEVVIHRREIVPDDGYPLLRLSLQIVFSWQESHDTGIAPLFSIGENTRASNLGNGSKRCTLPKCSGDLFLPCDVRQ